MIPVIDIFAGPGGLGEGFSQAVDTSGRRRYQLSLSIEKEKRAHETLRLRAFRRQFGDSPPPLLESLHRGEIGWDDLASRFRLQAAAAAREAQCLTLGGAEDSVEHVRGLIRTRLKQEQAWVLIGGPPCQAYSVVGRARNSGRSDYDPDTDHRQTLYVEYLQILADHAPPVFIMENVKGLLSARHRREPILTRILADLENPRAAIRASNGRRSNGPAATYTIHSLTESDAGSKDAAADFVVRAERHGVPQRRHRVILVGVRSDVKGALSTLVPSTAQGVLAELSRFPALRSGISDTTDSLRSWKELLGGFASRRWLKVADASTRRAVREAIRLSRKCQLSRGNNHAIGENGEVVLNHQTRTHMPKDLARYLYVSGFGKAHGRSPNLADFPRDLLPTHANVEQAIAGGLFSDRFRVQLADQPSTTVTSHISKDGHAFIHYAPEQCRSLTVREAAALQSFPDDYFFCGPRTSQFAQVGNAVPPELARQIAGAVLPLLV